MKKLIVGLVAAFLMAAGLVATTGTQASASCPYGGCVNTKAAVKANKAGKRIKIRASVKAVGTNKTPVGKLRITVKKKGFFWKTTVNAPRGTVKTPRLKKGKYTVKVRYRKKADSAFNSSKAVFDKVRIG